MTVSLMNPTPANVGYVEQRYKGACVHNEPAVPEKECGETTRGLTRSGKVTVPNLFELGLVEASKRVLSDDLVYTTGCLGEQKTEPFSPSIAPDTLLRVSAQCPAPGERSGRHRGRDPGAARSCPAASNTTSARSTAPRRGRTPRAATVATHAANAAAASRFFTVSVRVLVTVLPVGSLTVVWIFSLSLPFLGQRLARRLVQAELDGLGLPDRDREPHLAERRPLDLGGGRRGPTRTARAATRVAGLERARARARGLRRRAVAAHRERQVAVAGRAARGARAALVGAAAVVLERDGAELDDLRLRRRREHRHRDRGDVRAHARVRVIRRVPARTRRRRARPGAR